MATIANLIIALIARTDGAERDMKKFLSFSEQFDRKFVTKMIGAGASVIALSKSIGALADDLERATFEGGRFSFLDSLGEAAASVPILGDLAKIAAIGAVEISGEAHAARELAAELKNLQSEAKRSDERLKDMRQVGGILSQLEHEMNVLEIGPDQTMLAKAIDLAGGTHLPVIQKIRDTIAAIQQLKQEKLIAEEDEKRAKRIEQILKDAREEFQDLGLDKFQNQIAEATRLGATPDQLHELQGILKDIKKFEDDARLAKQSPILPDAPKTRRFLVEGTSGGGNATGNIEKNTREATKDGKTRNQLLSRIDGGIQSLNNKLPDFQFVQI
jgi:hypothetical protein